MKALRAMELAQAVIEPNPNEQFTFCLQYYTGLGYLVSMINETYDSFISRGGETATPFFYWHFKINGADATLSVDNQPVNDGDRITFEFGTYVEAIHKATLPAVKHKGRNK